MIDCKKHKAQVPESTCIARQKMIAKADHRNGFTRTCNLEIELACKGCEIGLALLKGEAVKEKLKICNECNEYYPATKEFFKAANRSKDKLMNTCIKCFEKQKAEQAKKGELRVCVECDTELELDKGFYRLQGGKDGFDTTCKQCRVEQKRKSRRRRKSIIELDLSAMPAEVYEALEKRAADEFRTVEAQAMWIIKEVCLWGWSK